MVENYPVHLNEDGVDLTFLVILNFMPSIREEAERVRRSMAREDYYDPIMRTWLGTLTRSVAISYLCTHIRMFYVGWQRGGDEVWNASDAECMDMFERYIPLILPVGVEDTSEEGLNVARHEAAYREDRMRDPEYMTVLNN
jgi:hypothetical protein